MLTLVIQQGIFDMKAKEYIRNHLPSFVIKLRSNLLDAIAKQKWRIHNQHNCTTITSYSIPQNQVHVGNYTYGPISAFFNNGHSHLHIGHFCSIASDVQFLIEAEHPTSLITTFPFQLFFNSSSGTLPETFTTTKGDIIVEDDVWIARGAKILSGVHIAQGTIVAAGAIVTHDTPPYAIVGGGPCQSH